MKNELTAEILGDMINSIKPVERPISVKAACLKQVCESPIFSEVIEAEDGRRDVFSLHGITITQSSIIPEGVIAVQYKDRIEFHPLDGSKPYGFKAQLISDFPEFIKTTPNQ